MRSMETEGMVVDKNLKGGRASGMERSSIGHLEGGLRGGERSKVKNGWVVAEEA